MTRRFAALAAALCLTLTTLTATAGAASYFPRYTGGGGSIVAALDALGINSSYSNRSKIAAANGITGYSGSAAQNTRLLELLKQGRLARPGASTAPSLYAGLTAANLGRVSFIRQNKNTCKATAAAMAVNVVLGSNRHSTASMIYSGVLCRNLDGNVYAGSDGNSYRAAYKTDSYVGSLGELERAVDAALSQGLPIVAAVHHWIVVVGRDANGGYLAVDPARSGSGSMASQARSMAAMGYSFGLADYAQPHYGYISFHRI